MDREFYGIIVPMALRSMEETMIQRKQGFLAMVVLMAALYLLGCGGVTKQPPKEVSAPPPIPYGEAGDASDLRGPDDGAAAADDGEKIDPKDLRVPGAEYGMKKNGAEEAPCPQGKKGKKCRQNRQNSGRIPFSQEIAAQMEGLPWGMHYKAVIAHFEKAVRDSYKELLSKAKGAVEEDRVRSQMLREIAKIKNSYVVFDGRRTGFEGAMIEAEFTHNNNESMFSWDAGKFVEYMFFFEGRFWKRVRTFRKDSFKVDITFDDYVQTLINRFGPGLELFGQQGELKEIKWQDKTTYMSARDQSGFYGVFVLVFAARVTEDNLAKIRTNQGGKNSQPGVNTSALVESALTGEESDHNHSVIDSYTGSGSSQRKTSSGSTQSRSSDEEPEQIEESPAEPPSSDSSIDDLF